MRALEESRASGAKVYVHCTAVSLDAFCRAREAQLGFAHLLNEQGMRPQPVGVGRAPHGMPDPPPLPLPCPVLQGLGRSPAVAIAALYWLTPMQLDEAYEFLTGIRPCGPSKVRETDTMFKWSFCAGCEASSDWHLPLQLAAPTRWQPHAAAAVPVCGASSPCSPAHSIAAACSPGCSPGCTHALPLSSGRHPRRHLRPAVWAAAGALRP